MTEVNIDTSTPKTEPVTTSEAAKSPEKTTSVLRNEVQEVGSILLFRQMQETKQKLEGKSDTDREEYFRTSPTRKQDKALYTLSWLYERPVLPEGAKYTDRDGNETGIDTSGGSSLVVYSEGKEYRITNIQRGNQENFFCTVAGMKDPVQFTRRQVVQAQMLSEASTILSGFTDGSIEQSLMRMYIDVVKGNDISLPDSQTIQKALKEVGDRIGMISAEDLRAFLDAHRTQANTTSPLTPEQTALYSHFEEVLKDRTIVDYNTMSEVFNKFGDREALAASLNTQIEELRNKSDKTPEETDQLKKLEAQKSTLELIKLAEGGEMAIYFKALESGKVDAKFMSNMLDLFKQGRIEEAVKILIPGKDDDPEVQKKRLEFTEAAKIGGIGLLAIIALAVAGAVSAISQQR